MIDDGYAGPLPPPKRSHADWQGQPLNKIESYGEFDNAKEWCITNIHHGYVLAEQDHIKHNIVFWIRDSEEAILTTLRWKTD